MVVHLNAVRMHSDCLSNWFISESRHYMIPFIVLIIVFTTFAGDKHQQEIPTPLLETNTYREGWRKLIGASVKSVITQKHADSEVQYDGDCSARIHSVDENGAAMLSDGCPNKKKGVLYQQCFMVFWPLKAGQVYIRKDTRIKYVFSLSRQLCVWTLQLSFNSMGHFGRSWSLMIFHWLICIQYQLFLSTWGACSEVVLNLNG